MSSKQGLLGEYSKMFPSLNPSTIEAVIEQCNRNPDQIVDSLLNLSCLSDQTARQPSASKEINSKLRREHAAAVSKPKKKEVGGEVFAYQKELLLEEPSSKPIRRFSLQESMDQNQFGTVHQQVFSACQKGDMKFVEYYFEQIKPHVKENRNEILHYCILLATENGNLELVDKLVKLGVSPNGMLEGYITPLLMSLEAGQSKCANLLLSKHSADPQKSYQNVYPIQLAVKYQNLSTVGKLCRRKVQLGVTDERGKTPLHVAIEQRNFEIVDQLIDAGAPLDIQEKKYGDSPLHTCVRMLKDTQDTMLFLALLNARQITPAILDLQNHADQTVLMIAVQKSQTPVVDLLLKKNANPFLLSKTAQNVLQIATAQSNQKLVDKLQQYCLSYKPSMKPEDISVYGNVKGDSIKPSQSPAKVHDDYEAVHKFKLYLEEMLNPKDDYANIYQEYEELEKLTYEEVSNGVYTSAFLPENAWKNRYKNILPYEDSRVKLENPLGLEGGDFINANYIHTSDPKQIYLATQGPLESTVPEFWRMVWDQKSTVIVMLANEYEKGRQKCFHYWPTEADPISTPYHTVSLLTSEPLTSGLISRTFIIKDLKDDKERTVNQIQYLNWPDQGVPEEPDDFLELIDFVDKNNKYNPPITVHCSAGIGRTGTFIAVHSCFAHLTTMFSHTPEKRYSIKQCVLDMRKERAGMVQTPEQYRFIYTLIFSKLQGYLDILAIKNQRMLWTNIPEKEQANKLLKGKEGHYLLRTTHARGYIVLSVNKAEKILHAKVNISHKGFTLENSTTQFKTIDQLIKKYSYMKVPLRCTD